MTPLAGKRNQQPTSARSRPSAPTTDQPPPPDPFILPPTMSESRNQDARRAGPSPCPVLPAGSEMSPCAVVLGAPCSLAASRGKLSPTHTRADPPPRRRPHASLASSALPPAYKSKSNFTAAESRRRREEQTVELRKARVRPRRPHPGLHSTSFFPPTRPYPPPLRRPPPPPPRSLCRLRAFLVSATS